MSDSDKPSINILQYGSRTSESTQYLRRKVQAGKQLRPFHSFGTLAEIAAHPLAGRRHAKQQQRALLDIPKGNGGDVQEDEATGKGEPNSDPEA